MKNVLIETLLSFARKNPQLYVLTGDLGFPYFTHFAEVYPKQYLNTGIAEQNMISVAAGLALSGNKIFIYSIIPFITFRCLEQIRNDLCYHNLDVKLIGFGAGYSYATHGITHFGTEDVAMMRALPNMAVFSPANPTETKICLKDAYHYPGPAYIRLGKYHGQKIARPKQASVFAKGILIKNGVDIAIISNGAILTEAIQVAERLKAKKITVRLVSLPCLKPIDRNMILKSAKICKKIVTLEEHSLIGGLGSAVSEVLIDAQLMNIKMLRIGLSDHFAQTVGSRDYLLKQEKLSIDTIVQKIESILV